MSDLQTFIRSRYMALALLVFALIAVVGALSQPFVSLHSSQAAAIEIKQEQIAQYQNLAGSQQSLQQELAQLQRRNPAAAYYVQGETPALAAARMRQFVKQVVDRNGGELISTQIVQQDEEGAENSARLRVHLRTDLNASAQILYLLESGKPLLFLDKLTISSRLVRGRAKAGSPQVSLDMNFDVTGFLQEGA